MKSNLLMKPAKRAELIANARAELSAMVYQNDRLQADTLASGGQRISYLDQLTSCYTRLLIAIDAKRPEGVCFSMILSSVGNPDFGQYHGEGVSAPTLVVESADIKTCQILHQAYIGAFDLGSGNLSKQCGEIWREDVLVARVSYNGRVWSPDGKEVDAMTGDIKAKAA